MTVQLPNGLLGVRRTDPNAVDAHGAPLPATPGEASALLPGKTAELDSGGWQLALDAALWPVRVGDYIVSDEGRQWVATNVKLIGTPQLTPEESTVGLGLDLDLAFVRVMANEATPAGTEPTDSMFTGRTGSPDIDIPEVGFGSQPFGDSPFGGFPL